MKIRGKYMTMLLIIALVPMIVASILHRRSMQRLGHQLADNSRKILERNARHNLNILVQNSGVVIALVREKLELALRIQAGEVERLLAAGPLPSPRLYFSDDYDGETDLPEGMVNSKKHSKTGPEGKRISVMVTYEEQVFFKVKSVEGKAVDEEIASLSKMPEIYRSLFNTEPDLIYWQYTSLETGFHSSYPGHGGYPEGYDPRERPWYKSAKEAGSPVWEILPEVSTRIVASTVAMPVYYPDGSFAGVTAIDISITDLLKYIQLPEHLSEAAEKKLVAIGNPGSPFEGKGLILAQESYQEQGKDWQKTLMLQTLSSSDTKKLDAMIKDSAADNSGVVRMPYKGRDSLWAYSAGNNENLAAVVVMPCDNIIAEALESKRSVLKQMSRELAISGVGILILAVLVAYLAMWRARKITRPIMQITESGKRLMHGDFNARVDIRTGDELQDLGEIFNSTGPKLQERQRMKQSLQLAKDIQQHLLPLESPVIDGFDIAGHSIYCEETGGDYYDFIKLMELGDNKLGIALGDVSGHGIGSALLMSSVRGLLRSHAGLHGMQLGKLFCELNTHLIKDVGAGQFMTLFYGIIDGGNRTLNWISGGHGPTFWLRGNSSNIVELESTSIPLGVLEDTSYDLSDEIILNSGDIVLIGTDGIWEGRNANSEMFGQQRMRDIMQKHSGDSASEINSAVVDAVSEFRQNAPQEDDITLVVIKAL